MREKIEKILEQVLMKHHDDISTQDEDAIAEAAGAVMEAVKDQCEMLKKPYGHLDMKAEREKVIFNCALEEMEAKLREE